MFVQPLSLSGLTAQRAVAPIRAVRAARAYPSNRDDRTSATRGESTSAGQVDSVEISREAQLELIGQLSEAEQAQVQRLKTRDREVRAHEQAHLSAAGPYARGGAQYAHQTGPDGRRYAVGGEVGLDSSPVPGDPEATIDKAQVVRAAALAPARPSAQDRQVAAAATRMEAEARRELIETEQQESDESETEPEDDVEAGDSIGSRFDVVV